MGRPATQRLDPAEIQDIPPRQRFRMRLQQALEDHPDMGAPELADLVATTLPTEEPELVQAFLSSEARNIIAWEISRQITSSRSQIFQAIDLTNRNPKPLEQRSEKARNTLYERVEEWREQGVYVLDMTRPQLLQQAEQDLRMTATYAFKALFKRELARGMPNDSATVGEIYTNEQIIDLTQRVKGEVNRGNFRLKVSTLGALSGDDSVSGQADGRRAQKPRSR